jgi:hypothetical protein
MHSAVLDLIVWLVYGMQEIFVLCKSTWNCCRVYVNSMNIYTHPGAGGKGDAVLITLFPIL